MALTGADVAPSTLPAEVRAELAQSLEPIRKDAHVIYRRNTREAMLSVDSPGYGKFSALAVRLIGECARLRNVDTPFPQAVRIFRGKVAGYFLLEPLMQYDETDPEQYPLRWYEGNRVAKIDLLPALQPHNLDVHKGYVMEVAVTLETLPEAGPFVVLHVGEAEMRPKKSRKKGRSGRYGTTPAQQEDGGVTPGAQQGEPADDGESVRSEAGAAAPAAPPEPEEAHLVAQDRSNPPDPRESRTNRSASGNVNGAPEVEQDGDPTGTGPGERDSTLDGP